MLSVLFPGLGHLYAGARSRALALAAVFLAGIQSVDYSGRELLVLPLLGIWLFGILDAIRVTEEAVRARAEGRQPDLGMDRRWAVGLVLVGAAATLTLIPGSAGRCASGRSRSSGSASSSCGTNRCSPAF